VRLKQAVDSHARTHVHSNAEFSPFVHRPYVYAVMLLGAMHVYVRTHARAAAAGTERALERATAGTTMAHAMRFAQQSKAAIAALPAFMHECILVVLHSLAPNAVRVVHLSPLALFSPSPWPRAVMRRRRPDARLAHNMRAAGASSLLIIMHRLHPLT
jgi:hypothetical protein